MCKAKAYYDDSAYMQKNDISKSNYNIQVKINIRPTKGIRGVAPRFFFANLGDFKNNLAQKGVGVRPLPPSGSAPAVY